ncbi:MAG: HlyD family efflux transporter periplasmic adaptor subunit [Pirellulaceae bacterium]|nr:HlyD family efflux transporter periplasmic adaptor subunit [Planctomycetales bacterium]MCA9206738.1 HlyD family efflux transporter periplasmic adaptor subunit [Planctomycetales bacterium]
MKLQWIGGSMLLMSLAMGVVGTTVVAQRPSFTRSSANPSRGGNVVLSHCVISLIDDIQIPAEQAGVLVEIVAQENARVQPGDLLAKVDASDALLRKAAAEAELAAAKAKAENDIEIRNAIATAKVADAEYADSLDINRRSPNTIAATQLRREQLTAEREHLRIDVAKMQQAIDGYQVHVRKAELDAAMNEIERRQVDAPIAGEVVQLYRRAGEWVQPGDPIMRLVRMDRLRVEGFVDAANYSARDVQGARVTISVQLPGGSRRSFEGEITFVSPIVEANGEYRVWAEVENTMEDNFWVLRPGKSAEMEIYVGTSRPASAGRLP